MKKTVHFVDGEYEFKFSDLNENGIVDIEILNQSNQGIYFFDEEDLNVIKNHIDYLLKTIKNNKNYS